MANEEKKIVLSLTELEAGFLNAAVCDFFHKMKASEEDPTIVWVENSSYDAARSLWVKVEAQTKISETQKEQPEAIGIEDA